MSIAEALERIAEFERIEDGSNHDAAWTAFNAKCDLLEYLRDHEPSVYHAYQQTLKPMALGATAS